MSALHDAPRLMLVVTLSEWAGAQHIVYLLASQLQADFQVTVACAPGGPLVPKLTEKGVRVVTIAELRRNPNPWSDLQALRALYRLMRTERFDIVHTHSTKAGLLGRLAARLAGVPVLFTAHGWAFTEGHSRWKRWLLALVERLVARITTKIICVSEYDRQLAMKFKVGRPDQLVTIHNGLDPRPWAMVDRSIVRRALGLPDGDLLITMIARLAVQKDPLTLLEASRRLPSDHWRVLLVGEGPLSPRVARFVAEHQLSDRVQLLGARMDTVEILAASDIFVLSSRWEGLPLTIIEAMMAGLPVVATRVGGVDELIEEGVTGYLVPSKNPGALTAAMSKLLQDESLRRKMGQSGRQRALERFTLDLMIQQTAELYRKYLSKRQCP